MAQTKWTPEQKQCIEAHGGTLLVSAAAGSGKTSVLIERILTRITDSSNPIDIDKLLVVTFTKAAAAEMKQRLSSKLTALLAEQPNDVYLQRQQILLPRASICTVDSFCSTLIRENFHVLGISPQFKIAEKQQLLLLRKQALTEALTEFYEEKHPDFLELAAMLTNGKNDAKLAEAVEKIYDFIQTHPDPEAWLTSTSAMYESNLPLFQTAWGKLLFEQMESSLNKALQFYEKALSLAQTDTVLSQKYYPAIATDCEAVRHLREELKQQQWDSFFALLNGFSPTAFSAVRKCENETAKEQTKALRDNAAACVKGLQSLYCGTEKQCRENLAITHRSVMVLYRIVKRFSALYSEKKQRQNSMDFSDIEHYALQLLTVTDSSGNRFPTALANELSARYEEILVDEYQDTNAVQDALFSALSRNETNLFFVGDVKQSIYGFRQAMPELFVGRRDSYPDFTGNNYPATITLGNNFRSRHEVTDAVNCVFRQLLGERIGGIRYDNREALIYTADYPEQPGYEPEVLLGEFPTGTGSAEKDTFEAAIIADRISQMVGSLPITRKDGTQTPLRYGDCCILLRNYSKHATAYRAALEKRGIPVVGKTEAGFFGAAEIRLMLSLLRCIDNPLQDIPLTAVLLSPLFHFTPDELAQIRLYRTDTALYTALAAARQSNDSSLAEKCTRFASALTRYRTLATTLTVDRLVRRIYEETSLPEMVGAREDGRRRRENLRLLHEQCTLFEQNGFRGLSAFIRYIDRLQDQHEDLSASSLNAGTENAVSIMTVHGSKGLEFPVVFLAGLGANFNQENTRKDLLLHPTLGAGIKKRDAKTFNVQKTLPYQGVLLALHNSERAEELRLLYVAMTRAREKLCLVFTTDKLQKKLQSFAENADDTVALSSHTVLSASSMGEWLLSALIRLPCATELHALLGSRGVPLLKDETVWDIHFCTPSAQKDTKAEAEVTPAVADEALVRQIRENIAYEYPHAALARVPAKLAASDIAHTKTANRFVAVARPAFMSEGGLTPAERGTAMHAFMQFANYAHAATALPNEIRRLTDESFLSPEQAASLDIPRLSAFFKSDVYARMCRASRCLREYHFTFQKPAAELDDAVTDPLAVTVIQGIADCVFEEPDGLVVVDYKTDRVQTAGELTERYAPQLAIYRCALQTIFEKPVKECLLYSFALQTTVRVD